MKQKIIGKEIVKDIARGMADSELMQKYNLSGGQLRSIFKQLGKLRAEKIQTLASDLRSGMSRSELMKKYQLSTEGLESALKRLLEANGVSPGELEALDSLGNEQRTERDLRGTPRNHPIPVVTICEAGKPGARYQVRDISENGVGVSGIRARMEETKSLVVVGDEFGEIAPFEFDAQCCWAKQVEPDGGICSGFRITRISEQDLLRLREFIQGFTFGLEGA